MKIDTRTARRARALRRELTDAECILWSRLKGRQLGWQFRAQHPIPPWIADFACLRWKLAVELDGATHHTPEELARDERRRIHIEAEGWTILRFSNDDVYRNLDGVLRSISDALPPPGFEGGSPPPSR